MLAANLPNMARDVREGRIGGKGTIIGKPHRQPMKLCPICKGMWSFQTVFKAEKMEEVVCTECLEHLSQGETACLYDDPHTDQHHFAFITLKGQPDLAGQMVKVPLHVMDELHKRMSKKLHEKPQAPENPS